jgi:excisionase family DNA binding protein
MATLKPSEAAKLLNVSVKTLQRWDRDGVFKAGRTKTNRRVYTMSQVQEFKQDSMDSKVPDFVIFL